MNRDRINRLATIPSDRTSRIVALHRDHFEGFMETARLLQTSRRPDCRPASVVLLSLFSWILGLVYRLTNVPSRQRSPFVLCIALSTLALTIASAAQAIEPAEALVANSHNPETPDTTPLVSDALRRLAEKLDQSLALSRPVLLGSRDPAGPSCVNVVTKGQVYNLGFDNFLDSNGGPGSTITALYSVERQNNRSPNVDFAWFQGRLKTYLQNQTALNRPSLELAQAVEQMAAEFFECAGSWETFPRDLMPSGFNRETDWPSYCMSSLDRAIADRDLPRTQRWAGELAAATFGLADLHRWLGFLADNHLRSLEFQKRCQSLFDLAEKSNKPYEPFLSVSNFPSGVLTGNGLSNYYEIERQAEQLFSVPPGRIQSQSNKSFQVPAMIWVMPELREAFLDWRSALGVSNQRSLDAAVHSPFNRSYLMNMLFRHKSANTVSRMRNKLVKFEAVSPNASADELMDLLMYRAQSFAGLEWDDRFQPELSSDVDPSKTTIQTLMDAAVWTNRFFDPNNYGVTYTLREAIMRKKLDCVRATDMVGTIFRNAGRSRFGHVRWCSEGAGHSVAAYLGFENNQPRTLLVDGLDPSNEPEVWPDAYFYGHAWPAVTGNNPTPYAVELYGRGIDSYVWLEGYIARGPNAGQLTTAAVPYLEGRHEFSTRKVFDGPYPQ